MDIFDFDRCKGQLSNHRQITISDNVGSGGVGVSPSSQFLYVSYSNYVFQYDLWAEDIFATKDTVAVYDGYQESNFFSTRFNLVQLAPNGKIYINSPSGVRTLHVIEQPDKRGDACDVRQHSIPLPNFNASTLANHPNYRLGPIDGSPADTLGIDNLPRAYYRIDRNAEDTLNFHFQDLSFYEAGNWSWTFGDGGSSSDRHPDHTYAGPGIYEVCLTVSNSRGSDTHCRTIELGTVSSEDPAPLHFSTFPNPVQNVLVFDLGDYLPLNGQFKLYDAVGREVFTQQVLYRQARFNLSHLKAGVYFYSFWDQGREIGRGKVVRGE
ncbi:PKD domain-containing protein [Neolewinella agarilytica]|uniref:PKD domain-containing protein n=1 Tax=Neolewinella agarilytica TaxID=478744 RepID=UPI0023553000|nr:PKD domain-containing protein [Neolewinella agarilytica]